MPTTLIDPFPFERLPEVRREHLVLWRQIRAHLGGGAGAAFSGWARGQLGASSAGQACRIAVEPGPILGADGGALDRLAQRGCAWFELRGPEGLEATLVLDQKLVSGVRSLLLRAPAVPLVGAPTPAERGLIAYAVAGLLQALGADCLWTLALEAESPARETGVEARVVIGSVVGLAWLLVDAALLVRRAQDRRHLRARRLGRLAAQALVLPVEAVRIALPAGELGLFGEGDVILSPGCPPAGCARLPALLRIGEGGIDVTVEGDEVTISGSYQRQGERQMSAAETEVVETTLAEELPVELVVELGRLRLTGAQVLDLEVGDVLALERPLVGLVDLRVGGRLVARGELVNIDGEAGVRLAEVFD